MGRLGNAGEIHKTLSGYSGKLRLPSEGICCVGGWGGIRVRSCDAQVWWLVPHEGILNRGYLNSGSSRSNISLTGFGLDISSERWQALKALIELTLGSSLNQFLNVGVKTYAFQQGLQNVDCKTVHPQAQHSVENPFLTLHGERVWRVSTLALLLLFLMSPIKVPCTDRVLANCRQAFLWLLNTHTQMPTAAV